MLTIIICLLAFFPTVWVQTILAEFACEAFREVPLERLMLVILRAFVGLSIEALLAIELVRCLIPYVAEGINIE